MPNPARTLPFDQPEPLQPPPVYAELRAHEPVARVRTSGGRAAWLVTSYREVATVLGDPRFVIVAPGTTTESAALLQDGEPHQRLRRLVGTAFTPRRVEALRPRVQRLADEQIDVLTASGKPADLVSGFAAPLSITVIAELLGVEIEDRGRFRDLADAAAKADFLADDGTGEDAAQAWMAVAGYVGGLIARKREQLGDDLLSALIDARDTDDGRLGDDELTMLALTILASGYLTATNAISVGTTLLATEGRLASVATCGTTGLDAVVEEVVRLQIGVIGEAFPRWAREDLGLGGTPIRAGDMVLARLGAANRDPAHFHRPDTFDPGRFTTPHGTPPHVAFGRGPHHCLGAALARLEVGIALRALAHRLPGLQPHGFVHDIEWVRSHADTGPSAVHITW